MTSFIFPVGYVKMHRVKIIDFQLNRWYSFGYARLKMRLLPQENWGAVNLMYITKNTSAVEANMVMLDFNSENIKSELVKQDVLILTGAEDHFIPLKMHYMQFNALRNARSVTGRIFTREEQGHNHCQVGNIGLALKVMSDWIKEKESIK
jgi:hypothetical protein